MRGGIAAESGGDGEDNESRDRSNHRCGVIRGAVKLVRTQQTSHGLRLKLEIIVQNEALEI
jgi:hypothetical protein